MGHLLVKLLVWKIKVDADTLNKFVRMIKFKKEDSLFKRDRNMTNFKDLYISKPG